MKHMNTPCIRNMLTAGNKRKGEIENVLTIKVRFNWLFSE